MCARLGGPFMTNGIKQHREESQSLPGHMHHTVPTALVTLRAQELFFFFFGGKKDTSHI